jgi:two-component sensor histidine kinase
VVRIDPEISPNALAGARNTQPQATRVGHRKNFRSQESRIREKTLAMTEQTAPHPRTLADAIVDTVREPLVVLDRDLRVVAASRSFYRMFALTPENTQGRLFYELADGQWDISALRELLEEVIPEHRTIEAYEIEHVFASIGRRTLVLNARQVFDEAHPDSALLLAMEDVTQRRASEQEKDELLREKELLLEEMRHRVANSLQIIASILLLKARTVQSEETRRHLQDAHQRVMSVATVQQQLRGTGHGDRIEIGPYLTKLCDSLAKSMIGADRSVTVVVEAGAGAAVSGQAVSIGLIVTELLINAVKHAFPAERSGEIRIGYDATESGWGLSVSDNGIGRSTQDGQPTSTGLGTSIVEALAHQLDARVDVSSGPRGTTVSVIHEAPAAPPMALA